MKLERKHPDVHVAIVDCNTRVFGGGNRKVSVGVRAIRERSGKWRIDKAPLVTGGVWAPWEPIDSVERTSLTAAKKAIRDFAKSCKVPR